MAKRFADTAILTKKWYRKLSPKMKATWWHLVLSCDHAGIWDIDEDSLGFHVGEEVSMSEIENSFGNRVKIFHNGEKLFIPRFVEFQYGALKENNNAHKSVIFILKRYGLFEGLMSPSSGDQDKDKDKDKDKEKEESVNEKSLPEPDKLNPDKIVDLWNQNFPDKICRGLGAGEHVRNCLDSFDFLDSLEKWQELFAKCKQSDWLANAAWLNLTWIVNYDNAIKVLNGNYDKSGESSAGGGGGLKAKIEAVLPRCYVNMPVEDMESIKREFSTSELEKIGGFGVLCRLANSNEFQRNEFYRGLEA